MVEVVSTGHGRISSALVPLKGSLMLRVRGFQPDRLGF